MPQSRKTDDGGSRMMSWLAVGVDVAKAKFAVAIWVDGKGMSLGEFSNTAEGFIELEQCLAKVLKTNKANCVHLVLEPTGGYELALACFGHQRRWQVSLPNPKYVREWAKGLGQRAKTDKQDALLLARFAFERQPKSWQPLPLKISELESLLERQNDLEQLLQQERNRLESLQNRPGVSSHVVNNVESMIRSLEEALAEIQQQIHSHLAEYVHLQVDAQRLRQVPGIGVKNVLPLLVLLYRWHSLTFGQGTAKGLTAYVGIDPQNFESGATVRRNAKISRFGNPRIPKLLYMGALGSSRGNNCLRSFYLRLVGRGKAKKLALLAAARKILVWAWAVFRQKTTFDPGRVNSDFTIAC
jgi:transposase